MCTCYNVSFPIQRFASEKEGDREVQGTMLELLNQLDGFSSHSDIKVSYKHGSIIQHHWFYIIGVFLHFYVRLWIQLFLDQVYS